MTKKQLRSKISELLRTHVTTDKVMEEVDKMLYAVNLSEAANDFVIPKAFYSAALIRIAEDMMWNNQKTVKKMLRS